jgi:phage gp36-like protein
MTYASAADLLVRTDTRVLFENCLRNASDLTEAALLDAIAGDDLSVHSAEVQAAALASLARINTALADASAVIDSYADGRYALPLSPVPASLSSRACTLALYGLSGDLIQDDATIAVQKREVIVWLEMVARGTVKLGADAAGASAADSADLPVMQSHGALFEDEGLY